MGCLAPCGSMVHRIGEQTQVEVRCLEPCGQPHSDIHGVARDAARLLVPIFEGWTVASISQLSSVRRERVVDVVPPAEPVFQGDQSSHSVATPLSTTTPLLGEHRARVDELSSLRNMVRQLIDVCRANQSHLSGLWEEVTTLRSLVNSLIARPPPC